MPLIRTLNSDGMNCMCYLGGDIYKAPEQHSKDCPWRTNHPYSIKKDTEPSIEVVTSKSGVKSTAVKNRFDLVPPTFLTRVAARFALGSQHYADYNWRDGVEDEEFVQNRINHMMIHWQRFLQGGCQCSSEPLLAGIGSDGDDDLAAVAWCIAMLMEFQEHPLGKQTIKRVLRTMNFTPSIEKSECICGYDARNNERDVNLDCPIHMPSSVKGSKKDETL